MKIRSLKAWQIGNKKRMVPLYRSWHNMLSRVKGHAHDGRGNYLWKGLSMDFRDWEHFREWSLSAGYCRQNNSLDRINSELGYSPENCQWISRGDNCRKAVRKREAKKRTSEEVQGERT